jgi:hypothetical protein
MALETIVHEKAFEIGMSDEVNPKHIVNFSLQPVGVFPERS